VFGYGVATTRRTGDPNSLRNGALATPKAKHYSAILGPNQLGGLLRAIDDYTGDLKAHRLLTLFVPPPAGARPKM
jgi:hypothetical protein